MTRGTISVISGCAVPALGTLIKTVMDRSTLYIGDFDAALVSGPLHDRILRLLLPPPLPLGSVADISLLIFLGRVPMLARKEDDSARHTVKSRRHRKVSSTLTILSARCAVSN